jgi:hypothetical protein
LGLALLRSHLCSGLLQEQPGELFGSVSKAMPSKTAERKREAAKAAIGAAVEAEKTRRLARTPSEIQRDPVVVPAAHDMALDDTTSGSEQEDSKRRCTSMPDPPASAPVAPAEGTTSSSSTGAPALTIDGLGHMFQAMMATMNRMEHNNITQAATAAATTAQVVADLGTKFDNKFTTLEAQFADFQTKTAARFAAMAAPPAAAAHAGPGPSAPADAPAAWVQVGSGQSWNRRTEALRQGGASSASAAGPAPAPAAAPAPARQSPAGANTKHRIWIKGFITTQTSMLMAASARAYLATLSSDLQADGRVQAAGFGVAISIVFSSKAFSDAAFDELREVKLPFINPETGISEAIRVTRDLPFVARSRNRVTGALWTKVNKHLVDGGHIFKGLAQSNGSLYVIVKESPVELFKVLTVKEGETSRFESTVKYANLPQFGISRELATAWSDEASGAQLG